MFVIQRKSDKRFVSVDSKRFGRIYTRDPESATRYHSLVAAETACWPHAETIVSVLHLEREEKL